ncbi:MAG: S-methyl-5'-thioadenosine phosphorylase [Bdellovibrionales bacterium]|nr:S-methyl-5'-thioadenosine phosphorylase [Bdellovibrionales bacterium]
MTKRLGIIGGSGLSEMEGIGKLESHDIDTPFGKPSGSYMTGTLDNGTELVFLPRHGVGHVLNPSEVNYRANIYGFKKMNVQWLLSVSAVGSLKENIAPKQMFIPDQFFDFTRSGRPNTFFEKGIVAHVSLADPVCETLRKSLIEATTKVGVEFNEGGGYIGMEGPQFSTRAESKFYRLLDMSVVGMTNLPEAKLAREAEISYATLALVTDYDCWYESEDDVDVHMVLETVKHNIHNAKKIIQVLSDVFPGGDSPYKGTVKHAVQTSPDYISAEAKERLALLLSS